MRKLIAPAVLGLFLVGAGVTLGWCSGALAIAPDESPEVIARVMADRIPKGMAVGMALWALVMAVLWIKRRA